jgi:hypothetical protein
MIDTTARAKLKILAGARQESTQQHGEALFGCGTALATVPLHVMTPPPPPRIFGVDAGFDISSHGVPHSFFAVSVSPCAPTDYKDNFPLGIFMDSFPICAEALGDVPCTTSELNDGPVQETPL